MEEEFLSSNIAKPFKEPTVVPDIPSSSNKKYIDILA